MIINHNISAQGSYRSLSEMNLNVEKSLEKLSSGLRINRAGDDAAGLAISEKMRSQIKGSGMGVKNAQDSISLIQTAEGALNETHSILQRMRELSVQAANDTNTANDRSQIQLEMNQLRQEVDRISGTTEFNAKKLIDGSFSATALQFHVGPNKFQLVSLTINSLNASSLNVNGAQTSLGVAVSTQSGAEIALDKLSTAIDKVSGARAKLGAVQNRLEHTINNLRVAGENLQAAESRIRDVDMAKEMVDFSKNKIITQSGTAMLAQANASPQNVLQLLK